jgi:DNA polymerase-1
MDKLLIIDGHNLLFQMFFGMPSRIVNSKGKAIQGTLGFVGGLIKIIKMVNPTHVVAIFDGEKGNTRTDINDNYKANRVDYTNVSEEDNPFSQLPDIYKALEFMDIKYTETDGFETDDVIASYVIKYNNAMQIVVSSYDSDFFQLITNNTVILRYRGKQTTIFDIKKFYENYGISPMYYADYKSMIGDNADNIKGIDKIGPKTATKLINEYGNILSIIKNVNSIEKQSIKNSVYNNIDRINQNYQLIKLEDKAPLPFSVYELQFDTNKLSNTTEILKKIGVK